MATVSPPAQTSAATATLAESPGTPVMVIVGSVMSASLGESLRTPAAMIVPPYIDGFRSRVGGPIGWGWTVIKAAVTSMIGSPTAWVWAVPDPSVAAPGGSITSWRWRSVRGSDIANGMTELVKVLNQ